jgi:hypothetical protein
MKCHRSLLHKGDAVLTLCYSKQMLKMVLFIVFLSAASCAASRPPIAEYTSSNLTESLPGAVSLDVAFDLSNNNDEPVRLVQFRYTVSVAGDIVYRGLAEAEQTLPRGSTTATTIPIVLPRAYLVGNDTVVWHLRGTLDYLSHGAFAETLVDSKLWQPSITISASDFLVVPTIE